MINISTENANIALDTSCSIVARESPFKLALNAAPNVQLINAMDSEENLRRDIDILTAVAAHSRISTRSLSGSLI
jgi:hypothetical protein